MTLIKNINLLLAVLFVLANSIAAQNFTVKGDVVNAETNQAVEFANIGIEDTYLGTASDIDGKFEIQLSHALEDKIVRISAVGYRAKSFFVKDWADISYVKIQLVPIKYGLSEIDIKAKSKVGYGIVKAASNLIAENYMVKSHSYKCYINTAGTNSSSVSQVFLLTDKTGYKTRSFTDAFQNRNYKIIENSTEKEPQSFSQGLTMIDQVINSDIARCAGNVLSVESVNDFEIEVLGAEVINQDSVWVISYDCKKPNMQNCGDPDAYYYSGKLWITIKDNVVLKNTSVLKRKHNFVHGNDFSVPADVPANEVTYQVETTYRKDGGNYVLDAVDYRYSVNSSVQKLFLKVVDVLPFDGSIQGRQYFNNEKYNTSFWQNFKKPVKQ